MRDGMYGISFRISFKIYLRLYIQVIVLNFAFLQLSWHLFIDYGSIISNILALKKPITVEGDILKYLIFIIYLFNLFIYLFIYFFFFKENKYWYFMWIFCQTNDSREMSRLIISEKIIMIK